MDYVTLVDYETFVCFDVSHLYLWHFLLRKFKTY